MFPLHRFTIILQVTKTVFILMPSITQKSHKEICIYSNKHGLNSVLVVCFLIHTTWVVITPLGKRILP
uniref:Uncharacterized protein n=1 Tax=Pararge aegeria TaxID=116150 RepID=S4P2V3_9NEOP